MAESSKNLTERTVLKLKHLIRESGLGPGEPFGIEADLEKKLQVSRPVLREAVSRLRALGILDSRQSVGLIIGRPDPVAAFEQALDGCATEAMELAELAKLRYALEIGSVDSAVQGATDRQVEDLQRLADEYANGADPQNPSPTIDDIEMEFHRTLLEATHSQILMRMCRVIATYFARAAREIPRWDPVHPTEHSAWEHRAIANAMAERNAEHVRALLGAHLRVLLTLGEAESGKSCDNGSDGNDTNPKR